MEKRTQLTVMLENRPGALGEVVGALARADVNIQAITINDGVHHGVLKLVPVDAEPARKALRKAGLTFSEQKVYAVPLANQPGSLAKTCKLLAEKGINIDFVYGSSCTCGGEGCSCGCDAVVIFSLAAGKDAAALLEGKSKKKAKKGKKKAR